jgi:hypothetical protein
VIHYLTFLDQEYQELIVRIAKENVTKKEIAKFFHSARH